MKSLEDSYNFLLIKRLVDDNKLEDESKQCDYALMFNASSNRVICESY